MPTGTARTGCGSTGSTPAAAGYGRDMSHRCRSPASVAVCSGSMVPVVLSAPNTGLCHPHEQTAWTPPSPTRWMEMRWFTVSGSSTDDDRAADRRYHAVAGRNPAGYQFGWLGGVEPKAYRISAGFTAPGWSVADRLTRPYDVPASHGVQAQRRVFAVVVSKALARSAAAGGDDLQWRLRTLPPGDELVLSKYGS